MDTKKVFHAQFLSFFAHLMYDTTPLPLDKKIADSNHLRLAYKYLKYKKNGKNNVQAGYGLTLNLKNRGCIRMFTISQRHFV